MHAERGRSPPVAMVPGSGPSSPERADRLIGFLARQERKCVGALGCSDGPCYEGSRAEPLTRSLAYCAGTIEAAYLASPKRRRASQLEACR